MGVVLYKWVFYGPCAKTDHLQRLQQFAKGSYCKKKLLGPFIMIGIVVLTSDKQNKQASAQVGTGSAPFLSHQSQVPKA